MESEVLFNSKNAYRVATALYACACPESNMKEVLVSDIARSARVKYATALYWINLFETCGFIGTTRYGYRENALCRYTRHIIVHLWEDKLRQLYSYMWIQEWEDNLSCDLNVAKLCLLKRAA